MAAVFSRARELGLIERKPEAAVDSTGLETRHVSAYFVRRRRRKGSLYPRWPKLTAVCDVGSHLVAGAVTSRGPSNDSPEFAPAMRQAGHHVMFEVVMADAAYDAEHNHRLCREELGVPSTLIPINPRTFGHQEPRAPYRREMHWNFSRRAYGRRWHVESVFSAIKRVLGSALRARTDESLDRECLWRVLTYDLAILRRARGRFSTEHLGS